MNNYVPVQLTYKHLTAGQWIKRASICEMQAGNFEIVADGLIVALDYYDNAILSDVSGPILSLSTSPYALKKLTLLINQKKEREAQS